MQRLDLDAALASAARARRWVRRALQAEHASTDRGAELELLVTELVTNAVRYGGAPIALTLRATQRGIHVEVSDGSPVEPVLRRPPPESTGGRGVALVDALALRWGVRPGPGGGKTVWADLPDSAG
ncbi:ATP-binding protein [Kineococcus gynurae]|uniref:ATP-binding protein n=1 Tax=Kineococcus gynurae TaxID=452979 RepID=A0ABV5LRN1_9ACTN